MKRQTLDVRRTAELNKMKTTQQENEQRYEQTIHRRQIINKHENISTLLIIKLKLLIHTHLEDKNLSLIIPSTDKATEQ